MPPPPPAQAPRWARGRRAFTRPTAVGVRLVTISQASSGCCEARPKGCEPIWAGFHGGGRPFPEGSPRKANEARSKYNQSVNRNALNLSSIDYLPSQINPFFMLLFKPILDRGGVISRLWDGETGPRRINNKTIKRASS